MVSSNKLKLHFNVLFIILILFSLVTLKKIFIKLFQLCFLLFFIPETTPIPTIKTKEEFLEDDEASGMAPKTDTEEGSGGSVDSKEGLASPDYVKPDQLDETERKEEEEELNIIEESGEKEIMKGNFIFTIFVSVFKSSFEMLLFRSYSKYSKTYSNLILIYPILTCSFIT